MKWVDWKIRNWVGSYGSDFRSFVVFAALISNAAAASFYCESIAKYENFQTCFFNKKAEIKLNNTTIGTKMGDIQAMYSKNNRNIHYLPTKIAQAYPALKLIDASCCSIQSITLDNFDQLHSLKTLILKDNFIETIPNDVFIGSRNIEHINIRKNETRLWWCFWLNKFSLIQSTIAWSSWTPKLSRSLWILKKSIFTWTIA